MRMCVGCREMKPKAELMRVVKPQDGDAHIDRTGKAPGPGRICLRKRRVLEARPEDAARWSARWRRRSTPRCLTASRRRFGRAVST